MTKLNEAVAKIQIAKALLNLGDTGAWAIAAAIFMQQARGYEADGRSKEDAMRMAILKLGEQCEALNLKRGEFHLALGGAYAAVLVRHFGGKKATDTIESLAVSIRAKYEPKGKVN